MTGSGSTDRHRIWKRPFSLKGTDLQERVEPPAWVTLVASRAWRALAEGGPDQLAPGLPPLGQALLVRDLPLSLPDRPPLVVYAPKPSFLKPYNRLGDVFGRWALKYPVYHVSDEGVEPMINRAWLTADQRQDPNRLVYWAATGQELEATLAHAGGDARVLALIRDTDEAPAPRPEHSHVVLLTAPATRSTASGLEIPLSLALPEPTATWPVRDAPQAADLATRCENLPHPRVTIEVVDSGDAELPRMKELWLELIRDHTFDAWGPFLGVSKTLFDRLQADSFSTGEPGDDEGGFTTTRGLVNILENMLATGNAPSGPDAREFTGLARQLVDRRETRAPGKASWIDSNLDLFDNDEPATLLVDASHAAARGLEHLKSRISPAHKHVEFDTVRASREPTRRHVVVTAAPSPALLRDLVSGTAGAVTFLLYPWEVPTYGYARRTLLRAVGQLGVRDWPVLPEPPEAGDVPELENPDLVPRPRTPALTKPGESESTSTTSDPLDDEPDVPPVVVQTPAGRHEFPPDRRLLVLRGEKVHDIDARDARTGDVLVVPRDGTHPSAHEVITRVTDRNPAMQKTHSIAGMWRKLLRQHAREHHPGASVKELWRALDIDISYHQFRVWLREEEPVAPRFDNLEDLLGSIGVDEGLATMIYNAALDHKSDRDRVYKHLLSLARNRIPAIISGADETVDADRGVSAEDLHAILTFQRITQVTHP